MTMKCLLVLLLVTFSNAYRVTVNMNDLAMKTGDTTKSDVEQWRYGKPLAPSVERSNADLYANAARVVAVLNKESHASIYEALLQSMIKKRGGTPGTFEENRNKQIDYVKGLYQKLLCKAPEANPTVSFVLGGTAVGKSTFVMTVVHPPAGTVHINADDIRSLLVGNYRVYSSMTGNGRNQTSMRFAATDEAAKDANKVRFWVQDQVFDKRCNFLADSYSVPAFVVNKFNDANPKYTVNVYFLEIGFKGTKFAGQPADFDKKVELSRDRIRYRIDHNGHASSSADLMPDGFLQELRRPIHAMALEIPMPIYFAISQDGRYDMVGKPKVKDEEFVTSAATSAD